jgi:N-acetylglucosamine-6-phosphate deacetylase
MNRCPSCNAPYEVGDAICARCGAELPAPYEAWEETADDGYDRGEFANPYPARQLGDVRMADLGVHPVRHAQELAQQLQWAGVAHTLFPPLETSPQEVHLLVPEAHAGAAWQVLHRHTVDPRSLTILAGGDVYMGEEVFSPGTVVLAEGKILEILNFAMDDPGDGSRYFDLTGHIVTAGFIDLHTHGMLGIDTNMADADAFRRWSAAAAVHGTTAVVPTTVACPADELRRVLAALQEAQDDLPGARLLGLHMESNFISPEFKGAQPPSSIFAADDPRAAEILAAIEAYLDQVCIVTVAPEVSGVPALIERLADLGITVALGHSAATYEQAVAGADAGATQVTHLFNAMAPLHHRNPGLVGAALERDELFTQMVCDGVHVHPAVISMAISAKGAERFVPITDSLQGAGMPDGSEFFLGGQHVTVHDGVARLDSGTIAGSIMTMDAVVRFLVDRVGWNLAEALSMAATSPADAINRPDLGRLHHNAAADITVLDADLQVRLTFVDGELAYQAVP